VESNASPAQRGHLTLFGGLALLVEQVPDNCSRAKGRRHGHNDNPLPEFQSVFFRHNVSLSL
jgi:hypothetical protein